MTPEQVEQAVEAQAFLVGGFDSKLKDGRRAHEAAITPEALRALLSPPEVPEGDYDRAIAALAFWVIPKWVTWCALSHDSRSGASLYYGDGEPKATEKNPFGELHNWTSTGRFGVYKGILRDVENLPDWRTSLRRVEKGRVVQ